MLLADVYSRCERLIGDLAEAQVAGSALRDALAERDGNRRLAGVRRALHDLRALSLPRPLRLRLAVLENAARHYDPLAPWLVSELDAQLDRRGLPREWIAPDSDQPVLARMRSRFPQPGWRIARLEGLPQHQRARSGDPRDAAQFLADVALRHALAGEAMVMWPVSDWPLLRIQMEALLQVATPLFAASLDVAVIGPDADWLFDHWHEGEIDFAFAACPP